MLINQQIDKKDVPNPIDGLPSLATDDLIALMRVDKTMGSERIAGYIKTAYRTINRQIPIVAARMSAQMTGEFTGTCVWEHAPTLYSHHHRLSSDTPKLTNFLSVVSDPFWQDTYKDAVLHEAAALMSDNYKDFDTIGQGITRGINERVKSDDLRRIVNHAIADLTGKKRNRVSLL